MTFWQAVLLGIIQGLTEYLPISSTAHLKVVPALLGWDDPGAPFTAVIQIGTWVAVLWYFRTDIVHITRATLRGIVSRRPFEDPDAKLGWMIVLGTVPVAVCGIAFKKHIEDTLRSLYVISAAAIFGALALWAAELWAKHRQRTGNKPRALAELGWVDAIVVGTFQAAALIPGSSRSGVTITGGLFRAMTRETAARFSFLLSLPSILAAGVFELHHHREKLLGSQDQALNLLVSTVVAGIVGYATIAFLLGYLKTHSTYVFIAYRLVLGLGILALLFAGVLKPIENEKPQSSLFDHRPEPAMLSPAVVGKRAGS